MTSQKSTNTANNSTKSTKGANRRQRTPLGGHRRRLSLPSHMEESEEYHYHWFNDVQDRLERALAAGYEFVEKKELQGGNVGDPDLHNQNSDLNSRVSKRIRDYDIYLMRIPMEFYLEDEKLRQFESDKVDEAIFGGGADKVENSYGLDVHYKR